VFVGPARQASFIL